MDGHGDRHRAVSSSGGLLMNVNLLRPARLSLLRRDGNATFWRIDAPAAYLVPVRLMGLKKKGLKRALRPRHLFRPRP